MLKTQKNGLNKEKKTNKQIKNQNNITKKKFINVFFLY